MTQTSAVATGMQLLLKFDDVCPAHDGDLQIHLNKGSLQPIDESEEVYSGLCNRTTRVAVSKVRDGQKAPRSVKRDAFGQNAFEWNRASYCQHLTLWIPVHQGAVAHSVREGYEQVIWIDAAKLGGVEQLRV